MSLNSPPDYSEKGICMQATVKDMWCCEDICVLHVRVVHVGPYMYYVN